MCWLVLKEGPSCYKTTALPLCHYVSFRINPRPFWNVLASTRTSWQVHFVKSVHKWYEINSRINPWLFWNAHILAHVDVSLCEFLFNNKAQDIWNNLQWILDRYPNYSVREFTLEVELKVVLNLGVRAVLQKWWHCHQSMHCSS